MKCKHCGEDLENNELVFLRIKNNPQNVEFVGKMPGIRRITRYNKTKKESCAHYITPPVFIATTEKQ